MVHYAPRTTNLKPGSRGNTTNTTLCSTMLQGPKTPNQVLEETPQKPHYDLEITDVEDLTETRASGVKSARTRYQKK
jgi:hypothetical protein